MLVFIIDDHPLFREGLKAVLSGLDPQVQTNDFASVAAAIPPPGTKLPDLVLLDMGLPEIRGLDALKLLRHSFPDASVVVVSGDEDPVLVRDAIELGAAGYIPKTTDPELTIQALRLVIANGTYLPTSIFGRRSGAVEPGAQAATSPHFSERQLTVLKALLQGKQNKVIARELGIAEGTVKAHLWAVYQALGVGTRTQAMYRSHELRLFEPVNR